MTDNPYINKQNWGRDLLDRLNNFSGDDGSFNVWEELPTLGKNGQPLGQEHAGYTGYLKNNFGTFLKKWDGTKWEEIIKTPFKIEGENAITNTYSQEGTAIAVLDMSFVDPSFYIVYSDNVNQFFVKKIAKETMEVEWVSAIQLPSQYNAVLVYNSKGRFQTFASNDSKIFIGLTINNTAGELTQLFLACCLDKQTGALQWSFFLTDRIISMRANNDFLYILEYDCILHRVNPASGNYTTLNLKSIINDSSFYGEIFIASNGDIVTFTAHSTGTTLVKIKSDFSSSVFNQKLVGGIFYGKNIYSFAQDTQDFNKLYLFEWDWNNSSTGQVLQYDCATNTITRLALSSSYVVFSGIQKRNDNNSFFYVKGFSAVFCDINDGFLQENETYVNPGAGSTSEARDSRFDLALSWGVKIEVVATNGFGSDRKIKIQITSGRFYNQVITMPGTFSTADSIVDETTLSNTYSPCIRSDTITTRNLFVNNGSAGSPIDTSPSSEGLGFGTFGRMFGYYRWAGGLSANSISYTGNSRGCAVAGIGFNAKTVAGHLVTITSASNLSFAGIQLFDVSLGKMFFDIKNSGIVTEALISDFPSSAPIMTLTPSGVGMKNQLPAYPLDVTGTIRGTEIRNSGGVITSDPRLKTNMTSLNGEELWEICQLLNPITFVYKPDFEVDIQEVSKDEDGNDVVNTSKSRWPLPQGIQYGYNAVEVEELLPELVDEDPQGIKYLNSGALFPIFQAAATSKIQSLESEVESLKQLVQSLITRIEVLENA